MDVNMVFLVLGWLSIDRNRTGNIKQEFLWEQRIFGVRILRERPQQFGEWTQRIKATDDRDMAIGKQLRGNKKWCFEGKKLKN